MDTWRKQTQPLQEEKTIAKALRLHCVSSVQGIASRSVELEGGRGKVVRSEVREDMAGAQITQAAERTLAFILNEIKITIVLSKEMTRCNFHL